MNTNNGSTLTIRARRTVANTGFIMSGHGTTAVGETIRFNGIPTVAIGTVRNRQESGRVDSAYVQRANSNITMASARTTVAVNTTVHFAGQLSGIRFGRVTAVNATSTSSGRPNLTGSRANYASQPGDSGDPIYIFASSLNRGTIVGIHSRSLGAGVNNGFFVLIANTLSAFGIELF